MGHSMTKQSRVQIILAAAVVCLLIDYDKVDAHFTIQPITEIPFTVSAKKHSAQSFSEESPPKLDWLKGSGEEWFIRLATPVENQLPKYAIEQQNTSEKPDSNKYQRTQTASKSKSRRSRRSLHKRARATVTRLDMFPIMFVDESGVIANDDGEDSDHSATSTPTAIISGYGGARLISAPQFVIPVVIMNRHRA